MGVWLGNPDTTILKKGTSSLGSPIVAKVMEYAHKEVYAKEGKWKSGDWFTAPAGIQKVGNEVYPAWWNKTQGQSNAKLVFDKVSKKKANTCTPAAARIEISVIKYTDPVTKKDTYFNTDGYDATAEDDAHVCGEAQPTASVTVNGDKNNWMVLVTVVPGKFGPVGITVTGSANGTALTFTRNGNTNTYGAQYSGSDPEGKGTVTVTDSGYYTVDSSI
jgi:hypothetical protein